MTMTNAATEYKLPVMATSGAEDKEVVPLDRRADEAGEGHFARRVGGTLHRWTGARCLSGFHVLVDLARELSYRCAVRQSSLKRAAITAMNRSRRMGSKTPITHESSSIL